MLFSFKNRKPEEISPFTRLYLIAVVGSAFLLVGCFAFAWGIMAFNVLFIIIGFCYLMIGLLVTLWFLNADKCQCEEEMNNGNV